MSRTTSLLGLCALLLGNTATAAIVQRDLVITNEQIAPAGVQRSSILAGDGRSPGTFPGPLISGNKGDQFKLNLINKLTDPTMLRSTSIHWHGIHQVGTTWADGPAMVSQCPIIPDHNFLYDFNVYGQAGTFWYHSHFSTQYCDGLRGAFVVYDPADPYRHLYNVDNASTIITLADWYNKVAPSRPAQPDATLINGRGRTYGNPGNTQLAVITVEQGARYRFRVVGLSCDVPYDFYIHNHYMTVIEADGEYTKPIIVDQITVSAGQRYSVIVEANQAKNNYWIRASPNPRRVPASGVGFGGGINSAILRYVGADNSDPKTDYTPTRPLDEPNLRALNPPVFRIPDYAIELNLAFDGAIGRFRVNGVVYESPSVPVLLQILQGTYDADKLLPKGAVYKLLPNKTVEVTIHGLSTGGPHPFHMHGHSISIINSANSTFFNYIDPVLRDTVDTGLDGASVTFGFVTDNSGPWFLHCHIDWHIDMGLAIVFAEDPEGTKQRNSPIPPAYDKLCPAFANSPIGAADRALLDAAYPPLPTTGASL